MTTKTVLAMAAALCVVGCEEDWVEVQTVEEVGPAPSRAPFEERLAHAFADIEARGMPVLVAISHQGGALAIREFGALVSDGIPAEQTQVDLNSVTKTVTGVMVAWLADRNLLRFEETLADIFADIPADKAGITIHQLLTHSAGLRESLGADAEQLGKAQFLKRAFSSRLRSKPGGKYRYSNVGYGILAAIIEARTGKSYEAFLREDVMAGLEVELGYAGVYDEARSMRSAKGKTIREASWGGHEPFWNLIGNGGMVASVPDFCRFRQAVARGSVISTDMLSLVQTPHVLEDDEDGAGSSAYGYGVVVQDVEGMGRVYWHDGGNDVFSAQWVDYADQGDLIFTAGADSKKGDAIEAMLVMASFLYGYGEAQ